MLPLWQPAQTSDATRKLWLLIAVVPVAPPVVAVFSGFMWQDTQSMPLMPWTLVAQLGLLVGVAGRAELLSRLQSQALAVGHVAVEAVDVLGAVLAVFPLA